MKTEDWKSLLWMLILIGFIRAFVVEPFKIPSGSMIPTLLIGDHLFVAKSSYDIGIPFTNTKLVHVSDPKRGDVIVFEYPNPEKSEERAGQYYIKRVIGLPGDQVSVRGGVPEIVGHSADQTVLPEGPAPREIPAYAMNPRYTLFSEKLPAMDHTHWVLRSPYLAGYADQIREENRSRTGRECLEVGKAIVGEYGGGYTLNEICPFTVPPNSYFVMGDNRDQSSDSRAWGFVERDLVKGRALFIWLSIKQSEPDPSEDVSPAVDSGGPFLRWSRLGIEIK